MVHDDTLVLVRYESDLIGAAEKLIEELSVKIDAIKALDRALDDDDVAALEAAIEGAEKAELDEKKVAEGKTALEKLQAGKQWDDAVTSGDEEKVKAAFERGKVSRAAWDHTQRPDMGSGQS